MNGQIKYKHSSIYAGLYKADGTPLKCVELNER